MPFNKAEFLKNVIIPISKHFAVEFQNELFQTETIELDFHNQSLDIAKKKKLGKLTSNKIKKKRLYQSKEKILEATTRYMKKYIELMDNTIQSMGTELKKYEDVQEEKGLTWPAYKKMRDGPEWPFKLFGVGF